jgi:hypothetical protein
MQLLYRRSFRDETTLCGVFTALAAAVIFRADRLPARAALSCEK